jgi:AAA domain
LSAHPQQVACLQEAEARDRQRRFRDKDTMRMKAEGLCLTELAFQEQGRLYGKRLVQLLPTSSRQKNLPPHKCATCYLPSTTSHLPSTFTLSCQRSIALPAVCQGNHMKVLSCAIDRLSDDFESDVTCRLTRSGNVLLTAGANESVEGVVTLVHKSYIQVAVEPEAAIEMAEACAPDEQGNVITVRVDAAPRINVTSSRQLSAMQHLRKLKTGSSHEARLSLLTSTYSRTDLFTLVAFMSLGHRNCDLHLVASTASTLACLQMTARRIVMQDEDTITLAQQPPAWMSSDRWVNNVHDSVKVRPTCRAMARRSVQITITTRAQSIASYAHPFLPRPTDSRLRVQRLHVAGKLNKSQAIAILTSIKRSVSLWQGPPGTGKTNTLIGLMDVLAQSNCSNNGLVGQMLACSDTNAAADNIALGAVRIGLRVVRVGNAAAVRTSVLTFSAPECRGA